MAWTRKPIESAVQEEVLLAWGGTDPSRPPARTVQEIVEITGHSEAEVREALDGLVKSEWLTSLAVQALDRAA